MKTFFGAKKTKKHFEMLKLETPTSDAVFNNIMAFAAFHHNDSKIIKATIRAIGLRIQAQLFSAIIRNGNDGIANYIPEKFFVPGMGWKHLHQVEPASDYQLSLATDIVLPWPWSISRYDILTSPAPQRI